VRVTNLIPFVHVADVQRSIDYYRLLGFEVTDTHMHEGGLDWAALENDRAQIMLARASAPIDPTQQAVLFYLYSADLAALRAHLVEHGVSAGPIRDGSPGPREEMALCDPDGYRLMVAQTE
jgi:catechol 2,3-dioxygenase-like lactoylglutathione lyase family enzyme